MNTVSRQARPVITLNIVRTTKAVEAVRKTKEKRYMRGMMAQPYNISNMNRSPKRGPKIKEKTLIQITN